MARRRVPKVEVLGADFASQGVAVAQDWRYDLVCDYLKLSPSYQAVREHKKGAKGVALPADYAAVEQVLNDFGDLYKIREADWWRSVGMKIYGIQAPLPKVIELGVLSSHKKTITAAWRQVDSVVVQLPLALTLPQAIRQLRKKIEHLSFAAALPAQITPKYPLVKSKLRIETLTAGIEALKLYKRGLTLWQIGNRLGLIEDQCFDEDEVNDMNMHEYSWQKEVLSIAARRLIRTAVLIAENAARGRFPSDKSFKQAMMGDYKRKPGRPAGSKRTKRRKAGA